MSCSCGSARCAAQVAQGESRQGLPAQINGTDGKYARFWYGPTRQRYKQEHHQFEPAGNVPPRVTLYVGELFEKATQSSGSPTDYDAFYRHYIFVGDERVASAVRVVSVGAGQVSEE